MAEPFSEDDIRRNDLPKDVFDILHDLAYSEPDQWPWKWDSIIERAQKALKGNA
jgi:hypothetical protein